MPLMTHGQTPENRISWCVLLHDEPWHPEEDIFVTDSDRKVFLDGLADSCETHSIKLIAYVLMSNHFNLLVQTLRANLSEFMRHFSVTYTVEFNHRNGRNGHVFQNRARLKAKLNSSRKLKKQFHLIQEQISKLSNTKI